MLQNQGQESSDLTMAQVQALCAAWPDDGAPDCYSACRGNMYFFTLVWLTKLGNRVADPTAVLHDDDGGPLTQAAAAIVIKQIAGNLQAWGEVVAALKGERVRWGRHVVTQAEDALVVAAPGRTRYDCQEAVDAAQLGVAQRETQFQQEWELLRIQLGEGVARYPCPAAAKDGAVSDTLLNFLTTSERIPPPSQLLALDDVLGVAEALGEQLVRLYDFTSPYYAYAKRAAHNALMDILRKAPHNDADELILSMVAVVDVPSAESTGAEYESARLAFRIEFQRMLDAIDQVLPLRQHLVVRLTLALRPQFRRALQLIPGTPPLLGPEVDETLRVDQKIAESITRHAPDRPASETDVAVLRFHAKKKIYRYDAVLGGLLTRFMEK